MKFRLGSRLRPGELLTSTKKLAAATSVELWAVPVDCPNRLIPLFRIGD